MPIIKNSSNEGDYYYKIAIFPKGQIKYTNESGVMSLSNYYANTYGTFGANSCFTADGYVSPYDMIVLWAELPDATDGYFFGNIGTGTANLYLRKSSGKIIFGIGSSTVQVNYVSGRHCYGFLPYTENGVNGHKLMYDGSLVNDTLYTYSLNNQSGVYNVGAAKNGSTYTGLSGAKIYKAIVRCGIKLTSGAVRVSDVRTYHYYPCTTNAPSSQTTCSWYETRIKQAVLTSGSIHGTCTPSLIAAPYGVSIDDLRETFNSPYHDLLAIIMADNGHPEVGAEDPDHVTGYDDYDDLVTRDYAFAVAPTEDATHQDRDTPGFRLPLKTGFVLTPHKRMEASSEISHVDQWVHIVGELLAGRKPYWNLWGDGQRHNLFIHAKNASDPTDPYDGRDGYVYRYYVFGDVGSYNPELKLENYEGYTNDKKQSHEPFIELAPDFPTQDDKPYLSVEYHNFALCQCTSDTWIPDYSHGTRYDDKSVFTDSKNIAGGKVYMALGNLPDWNQDRPTASSPMKDSVFGMAALVRCQLTDTSTSHERCIMRAYAQTSLFDGNQRIAFCNDYLVPEDTEAKLQLNLFRAGKDGLDEATSPRKEFPFELYLNQLTNNEKNDFLSKLHSGIDSYIELAASLFSNPDFPEGWAYYIYTKRLVGQIPITIKGENNPKIFSSTTTNYRFVLRTPTVTLNGTSYYIFPVWTSGGGGTQASAFGYPATCYTIDASSGNGVMFYFVLLNCPPEEYASIDNLVNITSFPDIPIKIRLTGHPTATEKSNEWWEKTLTTYNDYTPGSTAEYFKAKRYVSPVTGSLVDDASIQYTIFHDGEWPLKNTGSGTYYARYSQYVYRFEVGIEDTGIKKYTNGVEAPPAGQSLQELKISSDTTVELWLGE